MLSLIKNEVLGIENDQMGINLSYAETSLYQFSPVKELNSAMRFEALVGPVRAGITASAVVAESIEPTRLPGEMVSVNTSNVS
jgi:hypothetical protein